MVARVVQLSLICVPSSQPAIFIDCETSFASQLARVCRIRARRLAYARDSDVWDILSRISFSFVAVRPVNLSYHYSAGFIYLASAVPGSERDHCEGFAPVFPRAEPRFRVAVERLHDHGITG